MCNKLFLQKKKKIKNIEKRKKKKRNFASKYYFEGGFNYCTYNLYIRI